MESKNRRTWTEAIYRKTKIKNYQYYSNLVFGEKDKGLPIEADIHEWRKCIVLKPIASPGTFVRPGIMLPGFFNRLRDKAIISSSPRMAHFGAFGILIGPEDRTFFIIGKREVKLIEVGYIYIDPSNPIIKLY